MEKKISFSEILKKYTMVLVLVLVVIMFAVNTKGVMLLPQNVNNLVAQNAFALNQFAALFNEIKGCIVG